MADAPVLAQMNTQQKRNSRALFKNLVSLALVIGALVTQSQLQNFIGPTSLLLVYPAIFASAALASFETHLLGSCIATIAAWYYFVPPRHSFQLDDPANAFSIAVFALTSLAAGICNKRLRDEKTNIQKTNLELEEKNNQLEALISNSPIGLAFFDRDHRYLQVNESLANFNGVQVQDHAHKTIREIIPQTADQITALIDRVFNDGKVVQIEFSENTPRSYDSPPTWIGGFYPIRTKSGQISSVGAYVLDVTEQRRIEKAVLEGEAKFETLANSIPQITWTTDSQGKLIYLNDKWTAFTGTTFEEAQADGGLSLVHPDDRQRVYENWIQAMATQAEFEIEFRMLNARTQRYEWLLSRGVPVKNAQGQIERWFGTNTNIQDLRRTQEALEEALRARDEFLSIASHELKTPLTTLSLQSQILERDIRKDNPRAYSPDRIKQFSTQFDRQVTRLVSLVDAVLDISRIRSGNFAIQKSEFDLCELVIEVVERMKPQFVLANMDAPVTELKAPAPGNWDRLRIDQVLTNLLTNAIRYGEGNPIRIKVEAFDTCSRLTVQDQGRGIAQENLERIFNRFERAVDPSEVSGLGLGLFITQQIVQGHGGKLWVESQLGQGASFIVELPYP
ncbi:MAG: ATP-binding protein [Bdellovibrionia bacterium]